jgi:NAD(P)-dependent dehydrogenase (short-subunit alcohol dehydrogenase family)
MKVDGMMATVTGAAPGLGAATVDLLADGLKDEG